MATYRQFFIGFWDDPDIEPFSPEEKLVYLFLFTNRLATESGIYAISEKFIAERTCISINKIKTILNTLQNTYHKITYDVNIIFVHGFLKRNYRGKPELLNFSILKNVEDYPSLPCWNKFLDVYKNHCICNKIKEKLNTLPTLSQVFNDNDNDDDNDFKEGDCKGEEIPSWRSDYKIYDTECEAAFDTLVEDWKWISQQKRYYPGVNIRESLHKMFSQYWGTEAGWKKKKSSRTQNIDWKHTIETGLSMNSNKVWIPKGQPDPELEYLTRLEKNNAIQQ
jgi:hypothetical protein